jgi:hypothetical protein
MQIDDNLVNLTPGMAVTVEIKTGSRSLISYLLSPLVRYAHDRFHVGAASSEKSGLQSEIERLIEAAQTFVRRRSWL